MGVRTRIRIAHGSICRLMVGPVTVVGLPGDRISFVEESLIPECPAWDHDSLLEPRDVVRHSDGIACHPKRWPRRKDRSHARRSLHFDLRHFGDGLGVTRVSPMKGDCARPPDPRPARMVQDLGMRAAARSRLGRNGPEVSVRRLQRYLSPEPLLQRPRSVRAWRSVEAAFARSRSNFASGRQFSMALAAAYARIQPPELASFPRQRNCE